jgi:translation initiation factor 4E
VFFSLEEWVLWEHKASAGSGSKNPNQWKENMSELCQFSTVEDFWKNFNHLPRPSEVFFDGECRKKIGPEGKTVEEYSLFKKGIEPEWGDPFNVKGGEWFCRQYFEPDLLDMYWQNLVMGIVGETIEDGVDEAKTLKDIINGVRVVDKSRGFPMYKLELWVSTREPTMKDRLRKRLETIMTDGQSSSRKAHPKFEDHTSVHQQPLIPSLNGRIIVPSL